MSEMTPRSIDTEELFTANAHALIALETQAAEQAAQAEAEAQRAHHEKLQHAWVGDQSTESKSISQLKKQGKALVSYAIYSVESHQDSDQAQRARETHFDDSSKESSLETKTPQELVSEYARALYTRTTNKDKIEHEANRTRKEDVLAEVHRRSERKYGQDRTDYLQAYDAKFTRAINKLEAAKTPEEIEAVLQTYEKHANAAAARQMQAKAKSEKIVSGTEQPKVETDNNSNPKGPEEAPVDEPELDWVTFGPKEIAADQTGGEKDAPAGAPPAESGSSAEHIQSHIEPSETVADVESEADEEPEVPAPEAPEAPEVPSDDEPEVGQQDPTEESVPQGEEGRKETLAERLDRDEDFRRDYQALLAIAPPNSEVVLASYPVERIDFLINRERQQLDDYELQEQQRSDDAARAQAYIAQGYNLQLHAEERASNFEQDFDKAYDAAIAEASTKAKENLENEAPETSQDAPVEQTTDPQVREVHPRDISKRNVYWVNGKYTTVRPEHYERPKTLKEIQALAKSAAQTGTEASIPVAASATRTPTAPKATARPERSANAPRPARVRGAKPQTTRRKLLGQARNGFQKVGEYLGLVEEKPKTNRRRAQQTTERPTTVGIDDILADDKRTAR